MIGSFIDFIKTMYYRLLDDDILALGAQMAYYLILSFFPFLIFLMALIGHSPVSSQQVLRGLLGILPEQAYNLVNDTVVEIVDRKTGGLAPISGILALWFASNGIGSIITGLNKAYDEKEKRPYLDGKAHFHNIYFTSFYCHYFFFHSSYIWWSYKKADFGWDGTRPFLPKSVEHRPLYLYFVSCISGFHNPI